MNDDTAGRRSSRRSFLATAARVSVAVLANVESVASARADPADSPTTFPVPRGATDCHVHVIPDPGRFPFSLHRSYTPSTATAGELLALQRRLDLDRVVIVTPSVYGADNSAMLDALRQLGPGRARGVAAMDADTTPAAFDSMQVSGVRGIRLNLETGGSLDPAAAAVQIRSAAARMLGRPWHLKIYAGLPVLASVAATLKNVPVPVVLDHFAGAQLFRPSGLDGLPAMLSLLKSGNVYVLLSGAYLASHTPPAYPDILPLARTLISANPDRILWGNNWPHPTTREPAGHQPKDVTTNLPLNDLALLNQLKLWAPDAAARKAILVDNPARLYGF